jgi:hypothetical protein
MYSAPLQLKLDDFQNFSKTDKFSMKSLSNRFGKFAALFGVANIAA